MIAEPSFFGGLDEVRNCEIVTYSEQTRMCLRTQRTRTHPWTCVSSFGTTREMRRARTHPWTEQNIHAHGQRSHHPGTQRARTHPWTCTAYFLSPIPCRLFRLFAFRSLCISPSSPARQQGQHLHRCVSLAFLPALSDPHPAPFPSHPVPSGPFAPPLLAPSRLFASPLPAPFLVLTCLFTPASQRPQRPPHACPSSPMPAHPFLYPFRTFSPPPSPPCFLTNLSLFSHECAKYSRSG